MTRVQITMAQACVVSFFVVSSYGVCLCCFGSLSILCCSFTRSCSYFCWTHFQLLCSRFEHNILFWAILVTWICDTFSFVVFGVPELSYVYVNTVCARVKECVHLHTVSTIKVLNP